jgi:MoxR-like ATPase
MAHSEPCRSVVLIDEVDKAPRDFPNDILNEIEHMYFRVLELGNVTIEAHPALQPVIVITSNSEKDLPDAFLRRCIYYHIPFPSRERLIDIISSHLGRYAGGSSEFLDDALSLFERLRAPAAGLRKKPATAELLGWLITLRETGGDAENPLAEPELPIRTLSTLIKTAEDQQRATQIVQQWMQTRQSAE